MQKRFLLVALSFCVGIGIHWNCSQPITGTESTTENAAEQAAEQVADSAAEKVADQAAESVTDSGAEKTTETTPETPGEQVAENPPTEGTSDTLYKRLGEEAGIRGAVKIFLGKVIGDAKINGYFLHTALQAQRLEDCLVKQIAQAAGGPQKYDCKDMKSAHAGMGISKQDFTDLVGHLVDTLKTAKVAQADIDTIAGVLGPMEKDIVEDATNDKTIYQRVGRKPGIIGVITDFVGRVVADSKINAFFAKADAVRLGTCLVRQVCGATGGPCQYGKEFTTNPTGGALDDKTLEVLKTACQDMKTSHKGLGIAKADFDALAGHLVDALKKAGAAQADIDAIVKVLTPMCPDIVEKDSCTP